MQYRKDKTPGSERALNTRPRAPGSFTRAERAAHDEIIDAGIARGVLAVGDLPLVALAARAKARADALLGDTKAKATAVNAAVRLAADLLKALRLAPTTSGRQPRPAAPTAPRGEEEFGNE